MKQIVIIAISILALSSSTQRSLNPTTEGKPPEEVALQFYNWYLKYYNEYAKNSHFKTELSSPDIKLVNSAYQIISKDQFDQLKKIGFFSNEFFKNQTIIYNACNVQLRKVSIKKVEQCGCSPTEFVEGNDCDFMTYYIWVGGQGENLNRAKIIKVNTHGNLSKVTIGISADNYAYSRPEVTLLKEDGNWKISKIELHY
jgi:hypothetical protein